MVEEDCPNSQRWIKGVPVFSLKNNVEPYAKNGQIVH